MYCINRVPAIRLPLQLAWPTTSEKTQDGPSNLSVAYHRISDTVAYIVRRRALRLVIQLRKMATVNYTSRSRNVKYGTKETVDPANMKRT